MSLNIVILWAVYSCFLHPHYGTPFLLNGTSAGCICEAGAKPGNQVCWRTWPKRYTRRPHLSGAAPHYSLADDCTLCRSCFLCHSLIMNFILFSSPRRLLPQTSVSPSLDAAYDFVKRAQRGHGGVFCVSNINKHNRFFWGEKARKGGEMIWFQREGNKITGVNIAENDWSLPEFLRKQFAHLYMFFCPVMRVSVTPSVTLLSQYARWVSLRLAWKPKAIFFLWSLSKVQEKPAALCDAFTRSFFQR